MPKKKTVKKETIKEKVAEKGLLPEEAVKFQTHCKCGRDLSQTGYIENNYERFCSPACAS